jgi:hypothetical protein
MIQLDFPPLCGPTIETVINENYGLRVILPELIDNALDKRATSIKLYVEDDTFIVEDNGTGVANMLSLLQWGLHDKGGSTRTIGRYGIGFKRAAIWLAEAFEVETRHRNRQSILAVDWAVLQASGKWSTSMEDPVPSSGPSFTRFIFTGIRRKRLARLDSVVKDLAYEFGPSLRAGVRIELNGIPIEAAPFPRLETRQVTDDHFEGRHFRLTAGIKLPGDTPKRHGFDVVVMHRLIMQGDNYGCYQYSPQKFYGYLELLDDGDEQWTVATLKGGEFAERDALFEYLFPIVEPLLKAAQELGERIELKEWREELLERLSSLMKIRERRGRGESKGVAESKKSGATREQADKTDAAQPGSVIDKRLHGALDLRFDCHDPDKVGDVQRTKTTTIISLNLDFPIIKRRDSDGTIAIALALLAMHVCEKPEDFPLLREVIATDLREAFMERYTRLLSMVVLPDQAGTSA